MLAVQAQFDNPRPSLFSCPATRAASSNLPNNRGYHRLLSAPGAIKEDDMPMALLVPLLLLFLFLARPMCWFPFIDEHEHISGPEMYGPSVCKRNTVGCLGCGGCLFGLQQDSALFLARVSTALFNLITAAVLFDLGWRLIDIRTGGLAVLLYAISPYAFFYERMGLTDTYVTVWALLAVWFAFRYTRRLSALDAICCGPRW
jgi:hypothetical protein